MTKGQTEFVVAVVLIIAALGLLGHIGYKTWHTINNPMPTCNVSTDVTVGMAKVDLYSKCGVPDRIDDTSTSVTEYWYYDTQDQTVELLGNKVTAIHTTIPAAKPIAAPTLTPTPTPTVEQPK
jgi:hypothetical protein